MTKFWESGMCYLMMVLLIIAQCTVGESFFIGQGIYLIANIGNVIRDFVLKRPVADKVKNVSFTAITMGILMIRILKL